MAITTRQQLADFALRQLGGGINNIEITPEQIEDAIELTMKHYHEYHFDGVSRDYLVHKITGTTMVVADATNMRPGQILESVDGNTRATITEVSNNTITINRQIGWEKFHINQLVRTNDSASETTIVSITLGDTDHGYIDCGDNIVGVIRILNISNVLGSSDYMFNMQYQIMMTEMQALTKAGASMFWQTMNYLGHLDFIMKKEKNFSFNRRMNALYLEISWGTDVRPGDIVVAEVYRALDEHHYTEVYDDIWVGRYVTALMKRQWGQNLSKYSGMQLPGGLTYNGRQILEDALADIQKLEEEALYSTSPLDFMTG